MPKIISFLFFLLLATVADAQTAKPKRSVQSRAEYFTQEIINYITRPDTAQQTAILNINIGVTLQFDSLKALNLPSADYKAHASKIYKQRDVAIKQVLTPFQYDEYMMLQAEKRQAYLAKRKQDEAEQALQVAIK